MDEPDTEPQPQIYLYGFREPEVLRIDPTQLARFLMGQDVAMDGALCAAIRAEFGAQERYRIVMLEAVAKACGGCLQHAFDHVGPIEQPVTDVHSAFWRGYAQGKYEAFSMAAAELSEISVMAALALEDKE